MEVKEGLRIHTSGILSFASDKRLGSDKVLTCGGDNLVGVWEYSEDDIQCDDLDLPAQSQNSIAFSGNKAFLSLEKLNNNRNVLVSYDMDAKNHSVLLAFQMNVTAIDVSSNASFLVAGSCDFTIKCVKLAETAELWKRHELDGQICSISISPSDEYFAVSTTNGTVHIFEVSEDISDTVKVIQVCPKFSGIRESCSRLKMAWSLDGDTLYLPGKGKVTTLKAGTWTEEKVFTSKGFDDVYSAVAVNDINIAAVSPKGFVSCWNKKGRSVFSEKLKDVAFDFFVTDMVMKPDNLIFLANSNGVIFSVTFPSDSVVEDDIDMEDINVLDDASEDNFDIGKIKSQYMPKKDEREVREIIQIQKPPTRKLPPMLISGKVNANNEEKVCLMWNLHGRIFKQDSSDDNSIEIFFNDSNIHEPIVINNTANLFELGDMSNKIVALAAKSNGDGESVLHVRHVAGWHRESQSWSTTMPEKEVIQSVVTGTDFVAVLTDMSFVRLYTANAIKRQIISVASPIYSMIASKGTLALIRTGALIEDRGKEEYQYHVDMYRVDVYGNDVIDFTQTVPLALSPESELQWVSFSNWGHLITMDTLFVVRLMAKENIWTPVFSGADHLKDAEDSIWPVSLSTDSSGPVFRYIYLKNRSKPSFKKTELVTSTPLSTPVESPEDAQSKLESDLMLNEILSVNAAEDRHLEKFVQQHSQTIVKLFSVICQKNREARGDELARIARHNPTVQILANFAAKQGKTVLAQKIADVHRKKHENPPEYRPSTSSSSVQIQAQRKVQLKRRPGVQSDLTINNRAVDENNPEVSMNVSLNSSLNLTVAANNTQADSPQLNPFKKHGLLNKSPQKKKPRGDFFDSMTN